MLTLRPSAAGVWSKCPGSVKMQAEAPSYADEHDGDEGHAAHWAASEQLQGRGTPEGMTAPNGVIITAEILEYIADYVEAIQATCGQGHIEEAVTCAVIHPELKGTPDYWVFDPESRTLTVDDFKFGWVIVEPYENWQMICYAVGILGTLVTAELPAESITVNLRITQPRPYHDSGAVRTWSIKATDLAEYAAQLGHAAEEALSAAPSITAGSHCKYCTARHSCPSADKAALVAIDITESAELDRLPDEQLGYAIEVLKRAEEAIKFRRTGLEQRAISTIQQGGHVAGWTTDHGGARRAWNKPVAEIFAMGDLLGIELRAEAKPITPTQAKKKGLPVDMWSVYSYSPPGKLKLKQVSDTLAGKAFGPGGK